MSIGTNCPICQFQPIESSSLSPLNSKFQVTCKRCGTYVISEECIIYSDIQKKIQAVSYILSGLSRELTETQQDPITIYTTTIDDLVKHPLVPDVNSIEGKAKKILSRLKEKSPYYNKKIIVELSRDYPLGYAHNKEELIGLLEFLSEGNLLKMSGRNTTQYICQVSAKGWNLAGQMINKKSKQGFIAIQFHEDTDPVIDTIKKAITDAGYIPECLRGEHFSDRLMDKAISEIKNSRFVVVDISSGRPSVFFEAGFATALDIEIIYICKKGAPREFYAAHYQCNEYTDLGDLQSLVTNAIKARIT